MKNWNPSDLTQYHSTFRLSGEFRDGEWLPLGPGTQIKILSLGIEGNANEHGDARIKATVELSINADVRGDGRECSVCGREPPGPDADACWYILTNHRDGRLCFAYPEDYCYGDEDHDCPQPDRYPVAGWKTIFGEDGEPEPCCGDCAAELAAQKKALKAKRK